MNGNGFRLLLGLVPPDEDAIENVLYGGEGLSVVASGADASELLNLATADAVDCVLVSAELPGLDAGHVARLCAQGLRTAGLALNEQAAAVLAELDLDVIVQPPFSMDRLLGLLRDRSAEKEAIAAAVTSRARAETRPQRDGSVLAVVGSKGAPGASELAASFAARVARDWPVLLAEFDGDGGQLALRLGADPREGSLLGLVRALKANEPEPEALLPHWLLDDRRGWPAVLLGLPDPPTDLAETSSPGLIERLLTVLAASFPLIVCDIGDRLRRAGEADAAVRLHRDLLVSADAVLLVLGSRQEQLRAGFRQLEVLLDDLAIAPERLRVVVNGQAGSAAPRGAATGVAITRELAGRGLAVDAWLPWDEKALRASVRLGAPLAIARPNGPYARVLRELVEAVLLPSLPAPAARKRRLRPLATAAERPENPEAQEVALPWRQ
jgi:Flp pilus assembly CpaE family ATPase